MYLKQFRTGFQKSISSQTPVIYKGLKNKARNYKIYGNSTQATLPEQYQQVEYLESTGTQYINTGIKLKTTSKLEISFERISDTEHFIFGSRLNPITEGYTVSLQDLSARNATYASFCGGNTYLGLDSNSSKKIQLGIHTLSISSNGLYVDDVSYNCNLGNINSTLDMYLFGLNNNGTIEGRIKPLRIHYCKIWDNDTLTHNFIPCIRKSDNVAGMFDTVNNVFYTNSGTGTFILGPVTPTVDTPSEIKSVGDKTANLFNKATAVDGFILATNGTVATTSYNNKATDYILVTQDNVTISGHNYTQPNVATVGLAWYDIDKAFISSVAFTNSKGNGTYTRPANAVYCRYTVNATDLNTSQFEVGTSASAYVPFGYKIEVVSRGKNLFKCTNSKTISGITYTLNSDGSFNLVGTTTANLELIEYINIPVSGIKPNYSYKLQSNIILPAPVCSTVELYNNTTWIKAVSFIGKNNSRTATFTYDNTGNRVRYAIKVSNGATINLQNIKVWLCNTSIPNDIFEPYTPPKTTTYYLNEPLRAIETTTSNYNVVANGKYYISDYIDKANNKVVRNVAEIKLNGSENWNLNVAWDTQEPTIKHALYNITNWKLAQSKALVDRFKFFTELTGRDFSKEMASTHTTNRAFSLFIDVSRLSENSLNGVKTWLASNPVTVAYILATPTEESITAQNLEIKEDTTIIESNNEVQPLLYAIDYNSKSNKN